MRNHGRISCTFPAVKDCFFEHLWHPLEMLVRVKIWRPQSWHHFFCSGWICTATNGLISKQNLCKKWRQIDRSFQLRLWFLWCPNSPESWTRAINPVAESHIFQELRAQLCEKVSRKFLCYPFQQVLSSLYWHVLTFYFDKRYWSVHGAQCLILSSGQIVLSILLEKDGKGVST